MKQPWRSHYNAICRDWVAKHNRTTRNGVGNCSSKTGSRRQSEKKTILKHFLKGFLEGKSLAPKWRKSANKSLSQPSCSHSKTIYEVQLQKTIVLRMQPKQEATLTHLHCDYNAICRDWVAKHNRTTRNGVGNCSFKTGSWCQSEKKAILKQKGFLEGKSLAPKWRKSADKSVAAFMQPLQYDLRSPAAKDNSITHTAKAGSNLDAAITMCRDWVQNTIELRATASEIVASKPDLDARAKKRRFWSTF